MYKLMSYTIFPVENEEGHQKHLLISQKAGKRNLAIPVYEKVLEVIEIDLLFFEAKELQKKHKGSVIVKQQDIQGLSQFVGGVTFTRELEKLVQQSPNQQIFIQKK